MRITCLISIVLIFSACKKSEIDQLPVDTGTSDTVISNITIENYISRTYRLTLGRDPENSEFSSAKILLTNANLDSVSRITFINSVLHKPDYRKHVYDEDRIKYLDNADTIEFSNWIYIFQLFLQDTSHQSQWPYFQYEYDRMVAMKNAYSAYVNDSIEIEELHRRMCNNYVYDLKHTGTANFVISVFRNLIDRNPTASEQQSAITMVNGTNAVLFLGQGNSKDDFINIFIQSNDYYAGQVVLMYLKYLNRAPGTLELADGTINYFSTKDFTAVQKVILTSDEFIGL